MGRVVSLLTTVEPRGDATEPRTMSVAARHEAVLADGRRLLLLDDRGWSASLGTARAAGGAPDADPGHVGVPDTWVMTSAQEIAETARVVVGPDEPPAGRAQKDAEAGHWAHLAGIMRRHGVDANPHDLARMPHDVALGARLLARLGRQPDGSAQP